MGVTQYTTPTFGLTFGNDVDLTGALNVYVTFKSKQNVLTKTGDSLVVTSNEIDVHLTQEETARFLVGDLEIQANWTLADGNRIASEVSTIKIDKQLLQKVIE